MQFAKVCRHALVLPALTTLAGCPWPYTAEHDAQVKAIAQEHSTKGAAIDAKFRAALAASLDAKIAADTPCPATFTKPGIEESRFSEGLASWADERRRKLGLPARESEIETMLGSRRQSGGDPKTHDTPFQSRAITIVETKSGFQTLRSASHLDRLREIEAIRLRNSDELKRMGGKDMVEKAKALASDPIDPLELVILATTIVAPKSTPAKPMLGTRSFASGQARGSAFLYR